MKRVVSQFIGFGHYVPERRIDNDQLENRYQLSSGWIKRRTGIMSRRWALDDETLVGMAESAGRMAIDDAGILSNNIGLMILATSTPDHLLPPTAPLLAQRLGISSSAVFDLSGACSGYLQALTLADTFVRAYKKPAMIVAANILSRRINHAAMESAILFGDAAGATILSPAEDESKGVLGVSFAVDGDAYDLISISAGGSQRPFLPDIPECEYKMHLADGLNLFSKAVKMMVGCAKEAMNSSGILQEQLSRFVPHQANMRIIENVRLKLGIENHKAVTTISEYGNSSAASIPLSLSIENRYRPFVPGEKILLASAGAGMTGGAVVLGF